MEKAFKDLSYKNKVSYVLCIVSFILGAVMSFLGMLLEPTGEIHLSVISTTGLWLSFSGAVLGISLKYATELEKISNLVKANKFTDKKEENENE